MNEAMIIARAEGDVKGLSTVERCGAADAAYCLRSARRSGQNAARAVWRRVRHIDRLQRRCGPGESLVADILEERTLLRAYLGL